jgi:hypothetical protein
LFIGGKKMLPCVLVTKIDFITVNLAFILHRTHQAILADFFFSKELKNETAKPFLLAIWWMFSQLLAEWRRQRSH